MAAEYNPYIDGPLWFSEREENKPFAWKVHGYYEYLSWIFLLGKKIRKNLFYLISGGGIVQRQSKCTYIVFSLSDIRGGEAVPSLGELEAWLALMGGDPDICWGVVLVYWTLPSLSRALWRVLLKLSSPVYGCTGSALNPEKGPPAAQGDFTSRPYGDFILEKKKLFYLSRVCKKHLL